MARAHSPSRHPARAASGRVGPRLCAPVARELGLEARLLLARPLEQRGLHLDCPAPGVFGYAIVAIELGDRDVLLDFNELDLPFDLLPARIAGSDALSIPLDAAEPCEVVSIPARGMQLTRSQVADLQLDASGAVSGTLEMSMGGLTAASFRAAMKQVPNDRRQIVYDSIASTVFPGAIVESASIEGADDLDADLVLKFEITGGTWGRRTSTGFAIPATVRPLALATEFAPLESRTFPLLIDLEGIVRDKVTVRIPEGLAVADLPPAVFLDTLFGAYRSTVRIEDGTLRLDRTIEIPPQRVEPLDYPDFRVFARQIEASERQEIQLSVSSPALK